MGLFDWLFGTKKTNVAPDPGPGPKPRSVDETVRVFSMGAHELGGLEKAQRVRTEAERELVSIGHRAAGPLVSLLDADRISVGGRPNPKYRQLPLETVPYLARALTAIGDPSAVPAMAALLHRRIDVELLLLQRSDPTALLGRDISATVGRAALDRLASGRPGDVGAATKDAARAMVDIASRDACLALIEALSVLRGRWTGSLSGSSAAAPETAIRQAADEALRKALTSPHDDVRRAADQALARA